jgi:hypothetical protein
VGLRHQFGRHHAPRPAGVLRRRRRDLGRQADSSGSAGENDESMTPVPPVASDERVAQIAFGNLSHSIGGHPGKSRKKGSVTGQFESEVFHLVIIVGSQFKNQFSDSVSEVSNSGIGDEAFVIRIRKV